MNINSIAVTHLVAKQFAVGNYAKRDGTASFFVYALGEDGNIYRLDDRMGGWLQVPMNIVAPLFNDGNEDVDTTS